MKRFLQISIFLLCLIPMMVVARDDKKSGSKNSTEAELQRKSRWAEGGSYVAPGGQPNPQLDTGFPRPFNEINQYQSPEQASISTGYYFYDSNERSIKGNINDIWKPTVITDDTTYQPNLWTKIVSGPRIRNKDFWNSDKNTKGKYFFRNPADMLDKDIFSNDATGLDTTDNAIAGPMPLGIKGGFYFNGLRYDSFYVSTNGVIALTNRRYVYGETGSRAIPSGSDHCYDPNSMDWFVGGDVEDVETDYPFKTRKRGIVDPNNPDAIIYYGDADGDGVTDIDGLQDAVSDDFGYRCSVLGADPTRVYDNAVQDPMFSKEAGIRSNGAGNNLPQLASYSTPKCKPALIAPFWGSLQMSQYNPDLKRNDYFGSCYFKREISNDKLTIGFYGMTFKGTINDVMSGTMNFPADARQGNPDNFVNWDTKIVLDRKDSSITIVYERLSNRTNRGASCGDAIRANTIAGIMGWARHVNYDAHDENSQVKMGEYSYPWAGEYMQYTHYFSKNKMVPNQYPYSGSALRYKQWKNTLRVANINYLVRDTDPANLDDPSYDFTVEVPSGDYELLAGEPLIGAIQPRVLIQNLTNDIQGQNGVNFVEQDFEFWTRFKIKNLVTGDFIYNRAVPVSKYCMSLNETNWDSCYNGSPYIRVRLCDDVQKDKKLGYKVNAIFDSDEYIESGYDGVPPYRFVRVDFDPFVPNEFIDSHIGRMKAYVIAEPKDIKNRENIGDQWPFDDTTSTRFFVMKRLEKFMDDVTQFHQDVETSELIPTTLKWVTIEAIVQHGKSISMHPLPPRGSFYAHMPGVDSPDGPGSDETAAEVEDPVIWMNRMKGQRDMHPKVKNIMTEWGNWNTFRGDEIRSYPIDMRGKYGAVLSLGVHRDKRPDVGYFQNYGRDWGEDEQKGPEGKTFVNGSPFVIPEPNGAGMTMRVPGKGAMGTPADMIVVEFAKPSDDGVNGICNIEEADWRHLPYRRGTNLDAVEDMAVLSIYGSGGYLRGFLEEDPDSTLTWPDNETQKRNAMRPDFYDTGYDWDFQKYSTGIPDTFINWQAQGAKNFRFRIRVLADDHQIAPMPPFEQDDFDNFFIDNVNILFPEEVTDIEMNSVRIQWPYDVAPPSQTTNVPIYVKISNGTSRPAAGFSVKVKIFKEGDFDVETMKKKNPDALPIYCRMEAIQNLKQGEFLEVSMPVWNARKHLENPQTNKFTLVAYVITENGDMVHENDTTYFDVEFNTAPAFSYDPFYTGSINGVGAVATNFGLSTPGSNFNGSDKRGGIGAITGETQAGQGLVNDAYAGKIASKFTLINTDYFTGYHAFLGSFNSGPDVIEFMLYKGNEQEPSTEVVPGTRLVTRRGEKDGEYTYDNFIQYSLDAPVELGPGTYWVSVSQLASEPLCLGGSPARTRMKITDFYQSLDQINGEKYWGEKGKHIFLDRNLLKSVNNEWVSDNYAAYMNRIPKDIKDEAGEWVQFTPEVGRLAYPHTNHVGTTREAMKASPLYLNASWFPMLRPLFTTYASNIAGQEADTWQQCADDEPIELVSFKADVTAKSIVLRWETASESNNAGFEVQRRVYGEGAWNKIAFVKGAGNSKTRKYYNYSDKEVTPNTVYEYRLRDLDSDGMVACSVSDVLLVKFDMVGDFALAQNTPNPVEFSTNIGFTVPENTNVRIEVINMLGNVVSELTNTTYAAGTHVVNWDCNDINGNRVPAGTYLYRMISNGEVITKKMTVVK